MPIPHYPDNRDTLSAAYRDYIIDEILGNQSDLHIFIEHLFNSISYNTDMESIYFFVDNLEDCIFDYELYGEYFAIRSNIINLMVDRLNISKADAKSVLECVIPIKLKIKVSAFSYK